MDLRRVAFVVSFVLLAGCSRDPHAAMLKFVASGDSYLSQGKLPEAILQFRNAVDAEPTAGTARVKLAEAYLKHGDVALAIPEYVRAADLLPDADVQIKAGNLLLLARRFDDAKVRAEKALARNSRSVDAQVLLANSMAGLKDFDAAIADIQVAIKLEPGRSSSFSNLGAIELGRGRREDAEKAFLHAVELDPRSVTARLALGNFYWVTQRVPDAQGQFSKALELDGSNIAAHRALAALYIATNQLDLAEAQLRSVRDLAKTPEATLALADFYASRNKAQAARQELDPLAQNVATAAAANVRLAALDRANRDTASAYKRLDGVLKRDPANLQALLLRSSFEAADGKLDAALASATAATQAHADSAAAQFALGKIQVKRRQTKAAIEAFQAVLRLQPTSTEAKLALSQLQLAAGQAGTSIDLAQEAVAAEPANGDARLLLVRGLIARGDVARATTEIDGLLTRYPNSAAVHVQNGLLLGRQRKFDAARAECDRARQLDGHDVTAISCLVALDLTEKHPEAARARVDAVAGAPDATPEALMLAGRTYAVLGDQAAAERAFKGVLAKSPSETEAYSALGQLYTRTGRLDSALEQFEKAAANQTDPVVPLTLAGMVLQAQGKTDEAQRHFERAVQLDRNAAVAANNLAWIYATTGGNLDVALQLAQSASAAQPHRPEINDTLGFILWKKGLAASALAPLQESVTAEPSNPSYLYHLGLAYAQTGDVDKARDAFTRALQLKPDFPDAADARSRLAALKSGH